jgi:hypothetical protein
MKLSVSLGRPDFISTMPDVDDTGMNITSHYDDSPGSWVRLQRGLATVSLGLWPGPVGPGTTITSTDGGHFAFASIDRRDGSAVFRWVPGTL